MKNPILCTTLALALAAGASAQAPPAKKAAPAATKPAAAPKSAAKPKPAADAPKTDPAPATESANAADPVVITVGGEKITKSQYETLISALPEQARTNANGPNKRQFAEQYAEMKALAQEARRRGADQTPGFKAKLALQSDNLLASDLFSGFKPTDEEVRAYYDQHKSDFDQVKASHILVRFKGSPVPLRKDQKDLADEEALAKAKDLRAKIVAGADFATLAKAESDDTESGKNGGALGTFGHNQMVAPFEQAAFALPIGQISEPVKTQFGYHLIKVEERSSRTFEEVKSQIETQLKPEVARKAIEGIKKEHPVVVDETYFGKPMSVTATAK